MGLRYKGPAIFPFPESRFQLDELDIDAKNEFLSELGDVANAAIGLINNSGRINWPAGKNRGKDVVISRSAIETDTIEQRQQIAVRGICTVSATIDEVSNLLITQNTSEFRRLESSTNSKEFLDGKVLYVLQPRTPENPNHFACIKWHAKAVSKEGKPRDYVYYEEVNEYIDETGQRVGFRVSKSISLQCLPQFEDPPMIRASSLTLHTYKMIVSEKEEMLELRSMEIGNLKGMLPHNDVAKVGESAALRGLRIREYIDAQRLGLLRFVHPERWPKKEGVSNCGLCVRPFKMLTRVRHHCRCCGSVICGRCSAMYDVLSNSSKVVNTRVCVRCRMSAKTQPLPPPRFEISSGDGAAKDFYRLSETTTVTEESPSPESVRLKAVLERKTIDGGNGNTRPGIAKKERNTIGVSNPTDAGVPSRLPVDSNAARISPAANDAVAEAARNTVTMMHDDMSLSPSRLSQAVPRSSGAVLDLGVGGYYNKKPLVKANSAKLISTSSTSQGPKRSTLKRSSSNTLPARKPAPTRPPASNSTEDDLLKSLGKISDVLKETEKANNVLSTVTEETRKSLAMDARLMRQFSDLESSVKTAASFESVSDSDDDRESFAHYLYTNDDSDATSHDEELPKGWRAINSANGLYYHHDKLNLTQWTLPQEEALLKQDSYCRL